VTQRFAVPGPAPRDATYFFPLPAGAAVHGIAMAVDNGPVRTRPAARREGQYALGLAALAPGRPVTIALTYGYSLPRLEDGYTLVVPLVIGPALSSAAGEPAVAGLLPQTVEPGRLSVRLRLTTATPIESAGSPTHVLARRDDRPHQATFVLSPGEIVDNRDFVFRYRLAPAAPGAAVGPPGAAAAGTGEVLLGWLNLPRSRLLQDRRR
jgi:hypothetical protein